MLFRSRGLNGSLKEGGVWVLRYVAMKAGVGQMQGKKKLTIISMVIVLCALMAAIIIFQGHPQEAFAANDKSNANSLVVYKTDQNKRPLNGAEFTLYDAFTDDVVAVKTTGGNDGTATFTNLKNGAYLLKETKLPHRSERAHV